jgi:hypothetical protein
MPKNGSTGVRPEIVEVLSPTRVMAKVVTEVVVKSIYKNRRPLNKTFKRVSIREWMLGGTFRKTTCCLCDRTINGYSNAWREASGNQKAAYRSARVCLKCWPSKDAPESIMVIDRGAVVEVSIGFDREVPNSRLVTTRTTLLALADRIVNELKAGAP